MDCSPPASSLHGILWAKYWSGFPFPSPEDLPNPGIKPTSLASPALAGGTHSFHLAVLPSIDHIVIKESV